MVASESFKAPSMVPQDIAIIMEYIYPPQLAPSLQEKGKLTLVRGHKRKGSPNIESSKSTNDIDDDISSSGTESEVEVEAQIAVSSMTNATVTANTISSSETVSAPSEKDTDLESSSSESSISESSFRPNRRSKKRQPSIIDIDIQDDPSSTVTYLPTTHEIPPSAIPVPSLPDPSTLPQEALEFVGEIATILPDSITIRGSGFSTSTARERRDSVLNEGSLLLLEDHTPLGYVSDTFGPTILPHYLVKVKRRESIRTVSVSHPSTNDSSEPANDQTACDAENSPPCATSLSPSSMPSSQDYLDFTKIFVSRAVYHIPSLSNFVFPSSLRRVKGSDASNIHDEEIAEHEQEFSDDEAEARQKRLRKRSRSPSAMPFSSRLDEGGDGSISVAPDETSSLYGASPYDLEYLSSQYQGKDIAPASPSPSEPPAPSFLLTGFEDQAVHDALMLARNSRNRRRAFASISEVSSAPDPSRVHEQDHQPHYRGRRRGRGRGKDHGRPDRGGRELTFRGQLRGRGHSRGPVAAPEFHDGEHMSSGNQRPSFSFEEYDPHMPRPPSPTSLAIARATGQWADGTPFPYTPEDSSGGSATGAETQVVQTTNSLQGNMPMHYSPEPYGTHAYYGPTSALPQMLGYQPLHVGNYGVAPHVNPRFAQAFQLPNTRQDSSVISQNGHLDIPNLYPQSETPASDAEPAFQ